MRDPNRSWIADYPVVDFPASFASFQSAALSFLKFGYTVQDMSIALNQKLGVTLASLFEDDDDWPSIPQSWFNMAFNDIFVQLPLFLRMCWLEAIAGSWCTLCV